MKALLITLFFIFIIKNVTSQRSDSRFTILGRGMNAEPNRKDFAYNEAENEIEEKFAEEDLVPNYENVHEHISFSGFNPSFQIKSTKQSQLFKRNNNNRQITEELPNNIGEIDSLINKTQKVTNSTKISNLLAPMTNNNETNELEDLKMILNQIYEELDTIKTEKMCTDKDPDGNDCDMNGTWNSAEIGLRIELSTLSAKNGIDGNKLLVNLAEKIPKKPTYRIDTTWVCSGSKVQTNGGPFYFHCTNHQSPQSMTIFHGICKRCGGFDTIFGEWIFQHIPSDCRQLWTFYETKRDVFHKNVIHHLKFSNNNNVGNNQTRLYSLNKNNETINSKASKFQRSSKNYVQRMNQDLFFKA